MKVFESITWALLLLAGPCGYAAVRPTVIELYTAEGCSSCPPAEALLGDLANRPDVIALGLHVDYWDGAGWADKYALRSVTQRQNQYARALRRASVVTPQFIVDGVRDIEGANRSAIMSAAARPGAEGIPVELSIADARLHVALGADAHAAAACEVMLFAYLPRMVTAIPHGENAGRSLKEFNIVRAMHRLEDWNGREENLSVALADLPADATQIAVIVQQRGPGPVVGAARIALR